MAKQIVFYSTSICEKFEPNIEIFIYSIEPIFTLGFMFKILKKTTNGVFTSTEIYFWVYFCPYT